MKRSTKPSRARSALGLLPKPGSSARRPAQSILVQKYGGTSVGSVERIHAVAERALASQAAGRQVVLVISAMAGETNRLVGLARETNGIPDRRELDVVATAGEQVAVGLVALAIQAAGGRARSILGHQLPILTDEAHGEARILSVGTSTIRETLAQGAIPVVAGFQGITRGGGIATLGRGGSDTTAVAVAAALGAECEIYTDVDGVFSADPGLCPNAHLVARISLDAMLALARHGAKVLHPRCVAIAKAHGVPVHVRSSFHDRSGTLLVDDEAFERPSFAGVALDRNIALIHALAESELESVRLLAALAERQVSFETVSRGERTGALTIGVSRAELPHARAALDDVGCTAEIVTGIAKVSVVGSGLSSAPVLLRFTQLALAASAVPMLLISDDVSIRCLLPDAQATDLLRSLHDTFLASAPAAPKSAPRRAG